MKVSTVATLQISGKGVQRTMHQTSRSLMCFTVCDNAGPRRTQPAQLKIAMCLIMHAYETLGPDRAGPDFRDRTMRPTQRTDVHVAILLHRLSLLSVIGEQSCSLTRCDSSKKLTDQHPTPTSPFVSKQQPHSRPLSCTEQSYTVNPAMHPLTGCLPFMHLLATLSRPQRQERACPPTTSCEAAKRPIATPRKPRRRKLSTCERLHAPPAKCHICAARATMAQRR